MGTKSKPALAAIRRHPFSFLVKLSVIVASYLPSARCFFCYPISSSARCLISNYLYCLGL